MFEEWMAEKSWVKRVQLAGLCGAPMLTTSVEDVDE